MCAVLSKGYSFGATETVTSAKLSALVDDATISGIVGNDISAAAITDAKINDVSGAKFTTLSATPSGAGILPAANGGTGQATLVAAATALMPYFYPVGTVLTFGVSTNPSTLLGFGTWAAIAGKVIVGLDAGQTEFDTLNETGGAKTHALTQAELAPHDHGNTVNSANNNSGAGDGNGVVECQGVNINSTISFNGDSTGSGTAHNNLQPYIVKYIWERVS